MLQPAGPENHRLRGFFQAILRKLSIMSKPQIGKSATARASLSSVMGNTLLQPCRPVSIGLQGSCILFLDYDRFDLTVEGRRRLFQAIGIFQATAIYFRLPFSYRPPFRSITNYLTHGNALFYYTQIYSQNTIFYPYTYSLTLVVHPTHDFSVDRVLSMWISQLQHAV